MEYQFRNYERRFCQGFLNLTAHLMVSCSMIAVGFVAMELVI